MEINSKHHLSEIKKTKPHICCAMYSMPECTAFSKGSQYSNIIIVLPTKENNV